MGLLNDLFLSVACVKKCDSYLDFWRLRKIYRKKKKGFVCDKLIEKQDGLFYKSMGVDRIRLPLDNGHQAVYCLYHVDEFIKKYMAVGVKYDLIACDDLKPIRSCTMKEFITLYGHIL
jgi:hypothetical protein